MAVYWLALGLAAAIVGLLLLNNRQYLFHTELHETGDWASDSLFVREAKQGWLLHGHYSRWNFYHPGPALFLTLAAGEAVFFDWLGIVPTPLNGQTIALCVALTLFFSLALAIFAQRLGKDRGGYVFFLPLALLFAIWHYSSANGSGVFLEAWPADPPILVLLCFLVASASTASGSGRELPLLVFAGGWLVHNYVAQPLFVVPLTLLAYTGLIVSCRSPDWQPEGDRREIGRRLAAAYRAFPRAHVVAGLLLAIFILPLLLDAMHGRDSNLSHIFAHLRRSHEPHKALLQSFCYFLTYGSYSAYDPNQKSFGSYSATGMLAFVELHWRAYLCWLTALGAAPVLFLAARRRPVAAVLPATTGSGRDRPTFIRWFYAILAGAFLLTLVWGMKQDGEMFYFNAFFNYSIYYGLALGLAAALAMFLELLTTAPGDANARIVICAALWLGVAAAAADRASLFKLHYADLPENRVAAQSVTRAAAATLAPGSVCFLDCDPWDGWPMMVGAVLQLDRLGYKARVNDNQATMFGVKRTITHDPADLARPIVRWRILPIAKDPTNLGRWPLEGGYGIEVEKTHDIDPAAGKISFANDGNSGDYAIYGWPPGSDWTWSDERTGMLQFHALPLPGEVNKDVEILISAWSFTPPGSEVMQRIEVQFDNKLLGTFHLPIFHGPTQPVPVRIHSKDWQEAAARASSRLLFRFPDAKSPESLGLSTDDRPLGGAFRGLEFHLVEKETPMAGK